jgi:ABC-type multidrug transport system fused ATPase/permease subunit
MGDKFGNAIQYLSTCIGGFAIGFIRGWKLTLVILSLSPLLFALSVGFTKVVFKYSVK